MRRIIVYLWVKQILRRISNWQLKPVVQKKLRKCDRVVQLKKKKTLNCSKHRRQLGRDKTENNATGNVQNASVLVIVTCRRDADTFQDRYLPSNGCQKFTLEVIL